MLAHLHPTPYRFTSKSRSVPRLWIIRCVQLCVRVAPVPNPPSAQSPFARFKVLPLPSGCLAPVSRRDSAFIAPTGSCAIPKPSPRLGITLAHGVFTGCYQPLLGVGPSRPYLCESFPTCLDPYPGGPQGAFTRFFPQGVGLPRSCSGSALHHILDSHFSPGGLFGAAAISSCSGPPVCLPPRWLPPLRPFQASGSRGFYFWASHSSLPPRGPDRLAVRIEQLTAGRLALPKIRSLVGCTTRPDPLSLHAHRECRDARSS